MTRIVTILFGVGLVLGLLPAEPAAAFVPHPISYLERNPSDGTFSVIYEVGGVKTTVATINSLTAPAISPTGERIAFSAAEGDGSLGTYAVFMVNTDGTGLVQLTTGSYGELDPAWSPDGLNIVYSLNNTGRYSRTSCCRLARINLASKTITTLTGANGAIRPAYSPDGSMIAYETGLGIYTVPSAGGIPTLRVSGGMDPAFTTSGDSIIYVSRSGTTHSLRVKSFAAGSPATIYTTTRTIESPDQIGGRVYFIEHAGIGYDSRTLVSLRSIPLAGGPSTAEKTFGGVAAELDVDEEPAGNRMVGDFNGDGRDDIAAQRSTDGAWEVGLSTGGGFTKSLWSPAFLPASGWNSFPGDFDGDGLTDIANFALSNGTWWVSRSSGSSFSTSKWSDGFIPPSGWRAYPGDFDGDGLTDIANLALSNGTWWVSRSLGTAFSTSKWSDGFTPPSGWLSFPGDFDGDGLTDIANFALSNGKWWVSRSLGTVFSTAQWSDGFIPPSGWRAYPGDFDGDGLIDIGNFALSNGTWWVSRSLGSVFSTSQWSGGFLPPSGWETFTGDFDGDGRMDIASYYSGNGTWWVSRSTGAEFTTTKWSSGFLPVSGWTHLVGDFTGDGRSDIASFYAGNGTWWVSSSTGSGFTTAQWNP